MARCSPDASPARSLDRGDLNAEVARQKAIFESQGGTLEAKAAESRSPLASGLPSLSSQGRFGSLGQGSTAMTQSIEKGFKKRAKPPSEAVLKKLKGECLKEVQKAKAGHAGCLWEES